MLQTKPASEEIYVEARTEALPSCQERCSDGGEDQGAEDAFMGH